ncbi:MAG: peptide ABC transporter substrate-binding protein [Candidatus Dormibacteria bacterium]
MKSHRITAKRLAAVGCMTAASLVLAACGSGTSGTSSSSTQTTAVFAEGPAAPPNYIFPLASLQYFSVSNINQFQVLMFRPLYWFGSNGTVSLNENLSLANTPQYSNGGKTVTITLKNYKWSDGKPVTSRDIGFWINLVKAAVAENPGNWAGYVPNLFPDNIASYTLPNSKTIVLNLTRAYSQTYFTYNQLSQLNPLPQHAWDKTSANGTVGNYDSTPAGATQVYNFLINEAKNTATYATNPLWQVVDGPFRLTGFTSTGEVTMVPNPNYSGPVKPTIKKFIELPFTTDTAEFNQLRNPGGGQKIDYGFVPAQLTNQKNVSGYTFAPWTGWQITYFPLNFSNPKTGPLFNQLYLRQAMQMLVDQPAYIKSIFNGYAYPTYGPIPLKPTSQFLDSTELNNPYPYDPTKAVDLLKSHGWQINANGTDVCTNPGTGSNQCGAGVASGAKLSFNFEYVSGAQVVQSEVEQLASAWSKAGIHLNLSSKTFNQVLNDAVPCTAGTPCNWDMAFWGGGWIYAPDYYPTGDELWATGAGSNSGAYSNPTADALIQKTEYAGGTIQDLKNYEDFMTKNLPVIWLPVAYAQLSEINVNLKGATPQDPLLNLNPENWRFN